MKSSRKLLRTLKRLYQPGITALCSKRISQKWIQMEGFLFSGLLPLLLPPRRLFAHALIIWGNSAHADAPAAWFGMPRRQQPRLIASASAEKSEKRFFYFPPSLVLFLLDPPALPRLDSMTRNATITLNWNVSPAALWALSPFCRDVIIKWLFINACGETQR